MTNIVLRVLEQQYVVRFARIHKCEVLYLTVERAGRHPSWMDREKLYGGLSTSLLKFVRHLILGNATLNHTGAYTRGT